MPGPQNDPTHNRGEGPKDELSDEETHEEWLRHLLDDEQFEKDGREIEAMSIPLLTESESQAYAAKLYPKLVNVRCKELLVEQPKYAQVWKALKRVSESAKGNTEETKFFAECINALSGGPADHAAARVFDVIIEYERFELAAIIKEFVDRPLSQTN